MRTANDNHKPPHHLVVEELPDGREVAVRAPLPEPEPMRMTGPDRGDFETTAEMDRAFLMSRAARRAA